MNAIHLRYCVMGASIDYNVNTHPQKMMRNLGITYSHSTPQSMGDQWWFWNCVDIPDELPLYLTPLELDPLECIGFGLNEKIANEIVNHR